MDIAKLMESGAAPANPAPRAPAPKPSPSLAGPAPKPRAAAAAFYERLNSRIRELFNSACAKESLEESDIAPLRELSAALGPLIRAEPDALLECFLKGTPEDYIFAKLAGMGTLSALVGAHLPQCELSPQRLALVGWTFFLGASGCERLDLQHFELTGEELSVFLEAVRSGTMRLLGPMPEAEFLGQAWEAREASGREEPPLFCRVLEAAELFEALCHHRPYRPRLLPHDAVKEVVDGEGGEPSVLRSLLRRVSIYPPGSFVELGDRTVARVTRVNPKTPTRPVVKPVFTPDGKAVEAPEVDLSKSPLSKISAAVDETFLEVQDPAKLLQLRARLWWRPSSPKH